ncbi:MAG TPA: ATP-binding cassette domain-containing protein [Steroidobacteraceae bacterium]
MIHLHDIRLRRGPQVLIESANLSIFRGEKIGIVGRNGSGKSSLLALIRGELAADAGDIERPAALTVASVAQQLPDSEQPVLEYVLEGDAELRALERAIEAASRAGDGHREALLHGEHEHIGGYTARSRAAGLACGLGFEPQQLARPLNSFSGGLRMRANLARALMRRSDLLLLDEPTNHLDLDAVLWLEAWLKSYRGTLLLVSHDREFLDAVVGRIVHLEDQKLRAYTGNYSDFELQVAAERARLSAERSRQEREIAHVRSFVERFRAKASKARQAQSRLKWLARLGEVPPVHDDESFEWQFAQPRKLPRPLVTLEDAAAGYEQRVVLEHVTFSIEPGERLGVLGRNGAGKSTLMRLIAGTLTPLRGTVLRSPDVEPGFLAQLELEQLDAASNCMLELARGGGPGVATWTEQRRRGHLGSFGFRGDRVFEPVAQFSGGERARLALAILVARQPNLLLLDEPTNHLDFDMRRALLVALQDFAGAVVVVSHDRALLRGVCDRFVLVGEQRVAPFDGDLEDYATHLAGERRPQGAAAGDHAPEDAGRGAGERSRRDERRLAAAARNRTSPLRVELRAIETALAALLARRATLERELADPALYAAQPADAQRVRATEHAQVLREIDQQETRWLTVSEALELAARET